MERLEDSRSLANKTNSGLLGRGRIDAKPALATAPPTRETVSSELELLQLIEEAAPVDRDDTTLLARPGLSIFDAAEVCDHELGRL